MHFRKNDTISKKNCMGSAQVPEAQVPHSQPSLTLNKTNVSPTHPPERKNTLCANGTKQMKIFGTICYIAPLLLEIMNSERTQILAHRRAEEAAPPPLSRPMGAQQNLINVPSLRPMGGHSWAHMTRLCASTLLTPFNHGAKRHH